MVSRARAKGNRSRRKVIDLLEKEGYIVAIIERTGRFIFPKDAFGLFDLLCIKRGEVKLVQISTNTPHSHKPFRKFAKDYKIGALELSTVRVHNGVVIPKFEKFELLSIEQYCCIDGGEVKKWVY